MRARGAGFLLAYVGLTMLSAGTKAQQSAPVDPAFFASKLYPVFQEARCSGCHAQDGVASATRLHFPAKDATPSQIEEFGLSLTPLVDRADWSNSLLLKKPTRKMPHTGGERIHPGSDEEKLMSQWVQFLAAASDETLASMRKTLGDTSERGPTQLVRRLTHSQYNNTVRDLLGDYSQPANRFPQEDYVDGFKNQLTGQGMPPLLVETYSTSAEKLALNAFRIGDVNGLVACKPATYTDDKCRDAFIRQFGLKAFRRPLSDDELQRYGAAFTEQARGSRKFLEGARVVVEAMLQSPNFLFHVEGGVDGKLVDYDAASRLSYLLWNTMPDATLFQQAAKGELRTPEGRMKAARRMIDDPRAKQALDEFFDEWLRFDRVENAVKARAADFTPEIAARMAEETRTLLQYLVWNDKNFMEALTADYTFVSSDLAALYKIPAPAGEFEMVKLPDSAHRAGILGHGSFLASTAGPTATSPTARGIFIRERLLCQHIPPPPPGVNTMLPEPTSPDTARTRRQLMTEHVTNPTCSSCHRLMDPIGFGLENFDAIGEWRDKESIPLPSDGEGPRNRRSVQLPIETQGEIAGIPNSTFSDARQLGKILADTPTCQKCIVRQMFRYSYGRLETGADEPAIDQIFTRFKDSGFRFRTLLLGLVESPEFLRRY